MTPLKTAIIGDVRKNFPESGKLTDEQLINVLFRNPRTLRLTQEGYFILKSLFTAYIFEIPESIKAKHQLGMSRMQFPYFLTKRKLVLFSELDAMTVKLSGGIELFLENCYQIDRY